MSHWTWKMDRLWTVTILTPPTWGFNPKVKLKLKIENCTAKVGQDNVNIGVVIIFPRSLARSGRQTREFIIYAMRQRLKSGSKAT